MLNVYCIPGMGVDGRLFKNLRLEGCHIRHIQWITPARSDTMASYAMKLAAQIDTSKPFALLGVSMGGMCAVELAKVLDPVKTFVISSCKKSSELSSKISLWRFFSVYKLMTDKMFTSGAMVVKRQFGITTREQSHKFQEMLRAAPKGYFSGAVNCIVTWRSGDVPSSVVQIHGSADQVLPLKRIKNCDYIIQGGTHLMIVDKTEEISAIILKELATVL